MIELAARAIEGHGGIALWEASEEVRVEVSSGGLAFATKLQGSAVRATQVHISTREQRVVFDDFPREGMRGVLAPTGDVRIERTSGEMVAERRHPRAAFSDLRHRLWWDKPDILYFAAQALWTYVSAPFVFAQPGYRLADLGPWREDGESWDRLQVRFPANVQTHCPVQVFYIDSAGLIRRHDYTAEPIGGWARAAHYCSAHETFDGLVLPTIRRVFPRRADDRRRAHPRLVWIDIPNAAVLPSGG